MIKRIVKTAIKAGVVALFTGYSIITTDWALHAEQFTIMAFGLFSSIVNGFMTLAYGLQFYNEMKELHNGLTEL